MAVRESICRDAQRKEWYQWVVCIRKFGSKSYQEWYCIKGVFESENLGVIHVRVGTVCTGLFAFENLGVSLTSGISRLFELENLGVTHMRC